MSASSTTNTPHDASKDLKITALDAEAVAVAVEQSRATRDQILGKSLACPTIIDNLKCIAVANNLRCPTVSKSLRCPAISASLRCKAITDALKCSAITSALKCQAIAMALKWSRSTRVSAPTPLRARDSADQDPTPPNPTTSRWERRRVSSAAAPYRRATPPKRKSKSLTARRGYPRILRLS